MMTGTSHGSLFRNLPDATTEEQFEELCRSELFRVERITSSGQSSATGSYCDQAWDEWVLVIQGCATLHLQEPEEAVHLSTGDWLMIAAHRKHRVQSTSQEPPTIWLAVHARDAAA